MSEVCHITDPEFYTHKFQTDALPNSHADYLSRQAIKDAPQADGRREALKHLIAEQKADLKDQRFRFDGPRFYPKLIKKANRAIGASRPVKGAPF